MLQSRTTTPDFAGVSGPVDEFDPSLVQGAHFRSVDVPEVSSTGETVTVTGILHYDNVASPISEKQCRVVLESPSLNQPVMSSRFSLSHCQTSAFAVDIPITGQQGQTVAVTLKAQNNTVAGWQTTETRGPFRIEIVGQGQKVVTQGLNYLPYAAAGAGVGYATAINGSSGEQAANAVLGAGAGVVGKEAVDQLDFNFNFPTVPVLATAGLLGAGAFALAEVTEATPGVE